MQWMPPLVEYNIAQMKPMVCRTTPHHTFLTSHQIIKQLLNLGCMAHRDIIKGKVVTAEDARDSGVSPLWYEILNLLW